MSLSSLPRRKIELFYDVVSPYSYFAFHTLKNRSKDWNLQLILRPFFLGGVMKATGNTPPAFVPLKAKHMLQDLKMNAPYFGLKLTIPPPVFPVASLSAQRTLAFIARSHPSLLERATEKLWQFYWGEGKDIASPDVLQTVFQECLKESGKSKEETTRITKEILESIENPDVKEILRLSTEEAVSRGAYGAPAIFLHPPEGTVENSSKPILFMGSDRFYLICSVIGVPWNGPKGQMSKM